MWNLVIPRLLVLASVVDLTLSWQTHDYHHSMRTQYFIVKTNGSFEDVEKTCVDFGGGLASFLSTSEFNQAKLSASMHSSGQLWVGLRYNASSNAFVWSSGKTLHKNRLSTIGISYNATMKSITDSLWKCFALRNNGLVLQNCSSNAWVMCEVRGETSAGDPSSGNPYTAYLSNVKFRNNARKRCQYHGGRLASFATMGDIQHARAVIRLLNVSGTEEFWIDSLVRYDSRPGLFWWKTTRNPVSKEIMKMINSSTTNLLTTNPRQACGVFHADEVGPSITIEVCGALSRYYLCEHNKSKEPNTIASTPAVITFATRPAAAAKKAKEMMSTFFSEVQAADVDRPDSLQHVVNKTTKLISGLRGKETDSEAINVMRAAQETEKFAVKYAKEHLGNTTSSITIADKQLVLSMETVLPNRGDAIVFPLPTVADSLGLTRDTSITLPAELFTSGRTVIGVLYPSMNKIVSHRVQKNIDGVEATAATRLNSAIIASSLQPAPDHVLEENVIISLRHLKEPAANEKPLCVFWDFHARTEHNGTWSTRGCRVLESHNNRTVCSCNHLTNFAVMMQVGEFETPPGHQLALSIITYIGCAVSLVGEILTVIAYAMFMNMKTEQAQIRVNLVVSIAVAQIVFLAGIDATEQMAACILVAVLIHYFYLVAFCWMLLEGVYLYLMVVKVFNTAIKIKRYYLFAWGFPSLMVLTSIVIAATLEEGIKSYLNNKMCWVSFENNLVWTFVAPVLLICFLNTVILARVLREMAKLHSTKGPDFSTVKQGLKACVVLFPLLGLTWVFGVLSVTKVGLVFQYIFTIFNSFQGLFIFIFHVARSHEIRQNFKRKKEIWTSTRSSNFAGTSRAMSNPEYSVSHTLNNRSKIDIRFPSSDSMDLGRHNQVFPSP